ncbi:SCO family protein [Alicyclobacillus sp.]|uniref:SCO family protein n=1 Tax=Alicyclobacillus sp. TaxID=61169 RepID=UPI0025C101F8|nr:SCO family protein [Alicyclobacillus sp.]MCL6517677.1 SCO family protein [Alicyclobacillus sp.]
MKSRGARWAFYAVVAVLVLGIAAGVGYMLRAGGGSLPVMGQASDFTAVNTDGRPVRFSQLDGKIRLVTFFYTHCPGPCPLTAYRLEQVQNDLKQQGLFGSKVAIVSVTLDPEHDSVQDIRAWASHYNPDYDGWYFLRPDPKDLPAILKAWGVYRQPVPNSVYISHTLVTELVDQNGNIRATYLGDNPDPKQMEKDIHSLIARWNWL